LGAKEFLVALLLSLPLAGPEEECDARKRSSPSSLHPIFFFQRSKRRTSISHIVGDQEESRRQG
jgi:hypothetical protein